MLRNRATKLSCRILEVEPDLVFNTPSSFALTHPSYIHIYRTRAFELFMTGMSTFGFKPITISFLGLKIRSNSGKFPY
jgi:hypothetical protein